MGRERPWHHYRQDRPSRVTADSLSAEPVLAPGTLWDQHHKGQSRVVPIVLWGSRPPRGYCLPGRTLPPREQHPIESP